MNGQPFEAGHHAATLRRHLWREHLGLIEAQELDGTQDPNAQPPTHAMNQEYSGEEWEAVADPLNDTLWELWTSQATTNTEVYRYLFRADPDDNIRTWNDYNHFAPRDTVKQGHLHDKYIPAEHAKNQLDRIRGHLVWMPLDFLCEEEMAKFGLQVNSITQVSEWRPQSKIVLTHVQTIYT